MPIDYENPSISDIIVLERRARIDAFLNDADPKFLSDLREAIGKVAAGAADEAVQYWRKK